jgi:hypothetical protein
MKKSPVPYSTGDSASNQKPNELLPAPGLFFHYSPQRPHGFIVKLDAHCCRHNFSPQGSKSCRPEGFPCLWRNLFTSVGLFSGIFTAISYKTRHSFR